MMFVFEASVVSKKWRVRDIISIRLMADPPPPPLLAINC